jgi:acetate kinase
MASFVLVLNAGSSSLKAALFDASGGAPAEVGRTNIDGDGGPDAAVEAALAWADQAAEGRKLLAAGHRIVHGGADLHEPQRLTPEVIAALDALTPLAPLHQPEGLKAVRALASARPELTQVACFDTAFHWTQPAVSQRIGIPRALHDKGVRRYGFHGLSYEHLSRRLEALDPGLAKGRVVAAHLGSGASLCAIAAGRSVETTMGFSPLDGLLMGTRPGQLDAGVLLYLLQHEGMSAAEIEDLLYRRSGLLGVSGLSADMRTLLASPDPGAAEAVDLYVRRAVMLASALAGAMGGADGIVFTGGVGENSTEIRRSISEGLAWLGLELDPGANAGSGERPIAAEGSRLGAWVIPADEEAAIAAHVLAVLSR